VSADLERDLRALAAQPPFPPTPDMAAAVRDRLHAPAPRRRMPVLRPAVPIAVALLLVLGSLVAVEPVRSAVLEALGLKGARIVRRAPVVQQGAGAKLDLGRRVTRAEAVRRAGFTVVAPSRPGPFAEVWLDTLFTGGRQVAFVRGRLLLTEIRASVTPIIEKAAGPGTTIQRVTVDGEPGFWLSGDPHQFAYVTPAGKADVDTIRLAGPTLLWERDGLLLRLEGARSKAAALAIARSVG
jgi:hypothetical protein